MVNTKTKVTRSVSLSLFQMAFMMKAQEMLLVCLLAAVMAERVVGSSWPAAGSCPASCECRNLQVRCQGSTLKTMPRLPEGTQYLYMYSSAIEVLDKDSFQGVSDLHSINIDSSHLKEIRAGAFASLPYLTRLYLFGNQITKIDPAAFNGQYLPGIWLWDNKLTSFDFMKNLKAATIGVSGNPITDVDFSAYPNMLGTTSLDLAGLDVTEISKLKFANLDNLKGLNLEGCKLQKIDGDTFSHMKKLTYLNVKRNKLTSLPQSILTVFQRVNVEMGENPFNCDCNLKWVKTANWGASVDLGNCASPPNLAGRQIANLTIADFKC